MKKYWRFMIDQGGTFTDVISVAPDKEIIVKKFLSSKKKNSYHPVLNGINEIISKKKNFSQYPIKSVKIGTTIGTNALLERKGARVLLITTKGFKDQFIIGTQQRDNLFARHHHRERKIYESVLEVDERISNQGHVIKTLNKKSLTLKLKKYYKKGINSLAVVLINSFRYSEHENIIKSVAKSIGFGYISCSHQVSPTINFTKRGFTCLLDAYLNPIIENYSDVVTSNIKSEDIAFMQSNGFLCKKNFFTGKSSVLSGPAGGVNAGVKIAKLNSIKRIIGFDMGGTSTDVWHYFGEVEKKLEAKISGVFIKTPSLQIDSIASGGGSIIKYENRRFSVGPESAGSYPGPACYRNQGPLTLTDCNLVLGRIIEAQFPKFFGINGNQAINKIDSIKKFKVLLKDINKDYKLYKNIYQAAEAFIRIAVANMSNAIKKITVHKGYDVRKYYLLLFGAASGQYGCKVADSLGIKKIIFHPLSSVLSAYGVGVSSYGNIFQTTINKNLNYKNIISSKDIVNKLANANLIIKKVRYDIRLKYFGSNTVISCKLKNKTIKDLEVEFSKNHKKMYGFNYKTKKIIIDSIAIEVLGKKNIPKYYEKNISYNKQFIYSKLYEDGKWISIKNISKTSFNNDKKIYGPVIFNDYNTSIIVEKNWSMKRLKSGAFLLTKEKISRFKKNKIIDLNPEKLEIFNNLFFSSAEQMGIVLKNTAQSINIKERLDFSCALFDKEGDLIANAPHIPIHLGAMSQTVKYLITNHKEEFQKGMSLLHNDPYTGGTHLPDLTVITPHLDIKKKKILFYYANRAHHSDVGGITPGSMPAFSKTIKEEGIVFKGFPILEKGKVKEKAILNILKNTPYPSRDPIQNLHDLKAQIAACQKGILEMEKIIKSYGMETVNNYVKYIKDNCTYIIRQIIKNIKPASFASKMDNGAFINVKINYDKKTKKLLINFFGTSKELKNNFNAPTAVTKSVIVYFLRTLIKENIPLNEGCLKEVEIIIPKKSMLDPHFPSPVVAGNVETSQTLIDILNASVEAQAACYGTMSNITFGDKNFGYYETICGGEGASKDNNGTDAVHCHMTNTSITDPEILEWNYPARIKNFSIRLGSGGVGKWKGGNGTIREIEFLKDLNVTILSNRRKTTPFGLKGGKSGKLGKNSIKKNNVTSALSYNCTIKVKNGDILKIETPGGGGFGKINY